MAQLGLHKAIVLLKHVKTKILIVFLCLFLLGITIYEFQEAKATVTSGTFTSYFPANSSLGFQHENDFVTLNIVTGTLNSSVCTLTFGGGGGFYRFQANETATIKITFNVSSVQVVGDQNKTNRVIGSGDSITVNSGNNVMISWNILIEPWLPVLFIIGMIGLGASFAGPLYAIDKIKHRQYYEGMRTGLLLTIVGISFVLAWLW